MTVTRDTRLLDLFDLPERVFAQCVARKVRTVGALLDRVGHEPDVLTAAHEAFLDWCQWFHHRDCQDAASMMAQIAEKLQEVPA